MSDIITKAKLQLRLRPTRNGGDRTTTGATTKLLLNHGKPNFTIQRSTSSVQDRHNSNPLSPIIQDTNRNQAYDKDLSRTNSIHNNVNNNDNIQNEVTFKASNGNGFDLKNGSQDIVIKSNGAAKPEQPGQPGQQVSENEASRVVLRRTLRKTPEPVPKPQENEDEDAVPEFIRRQRRIQERLAKENILDFEKRRSGYFTHVVISPSSPSRTSFVETMSSPAIVPSLEMPPPQPPKKDIIKESAKPVVVAEELKEEKEPENKGHNAEEPGKSGEKAVNGHAQEEEKSAEFTVKGGTISNGSSNDHVAVEPKAEQAIQENLSNGHGHDHEEQADMRSKQQQQEQDEEEEVAKAIEEVNKAVAGEEDGTEDDVVAIKHSNDASSWTDVGAGAGVGSQNATTVVVLNNGSSEDTASSGPAGVAAIELQQSRNANTSEDVSLQQSSSGGVVLVINQVQQPPADTVLQQQQQHLAAVNTSKEVSTEQPQGLPQDKPTAEEADMQALAHLKFEIKEDDAENIVVTPVLKTD